MTTVNSLPLEPSYDFQEALARVLGDRDLLAEIVDILRSEMPPALTEIRRCVEAGDLRGLERAAHRLRGSVVVLGAHRVSQAALALEMMGRDQTLDGAPVKVAQLDREIRRLDHDLARLNDQSLQ